jgi:asparagine synthase (glutamine-hydrolysing)
VSAFFLTTVDGENLEALASSLSFTRSPNVANSRGAVSYVVIRPDSKDLWGPAFDSESGLQVLLGGRVAFEEEEWRRAKQLPFQGGSAAKLILNSWLSQGENAVSTMNGPFGVVIIDARERRLHLLTDRMGIYPIFAPRSGRLRLCTHPDVLAQSLSSKSNALSLDEVTVAEVISTGRSVQPYTYWREIRQLDAGTHYVWEFGDDVGNFRSREYWAPRYRTESPPDRVQRELVEEFADVWRSAVRRRTHGHLGPTGIFLSGGADSRGMLFSMRDPTEAQCITFFDEPNRELQTARAITESVGAKHHTWRRDQEFYAKGWDDAVRISGGMWAADDAHQIGFLPDVAALNLGTLISGCYADWLFKGISFNRRPVRFAWPTVRYQLSDYDHQFFYPHFNLAPRMQAAVAARLNEQVEGIDLADYAGNALRIEERRLRPLVRESDACFRLISMRATPFDMPFADTEMLDILGRLSVKSKMNGEVFRAAVMRLSPSIARAIPESNTMRRVDAGQIDAVGNGIRSRLKRLWKSAPSRARLSSLATEGSWIDYGWYVANSPLIRDMWSVPRPEEREFFGSILGHDPWTPSIEEWKHQPRLFFQLLTVKAWLSQQKLI